MCRYYEKSCHLDLLLRNIPLLVSLMEELVAFLCTLNISLGFGQKYQCGTWSLLNLKVIN